MAKFRGDVPGEAGDGGFATEQGGSTGYAGIQNILNFRARKRRDGSSDGYDRPEGYRYEGEKFGKEYFKNLAALEREKANLRDWEHGNRTQRDWQTMAERATIGDQELTRQTTVHTPNLIEAVGNRSWSGATTAGNKMSLGAGKEQPPIPTTPIRPTGPKPDDIIEGEIVNDPPRPTGPKRPALPAPPDRSNDPRRGPGTAPPVMLRGGKGEKSRKNPEYTAWQQRRDAFEGGIQSDTGYKPDRGALAKEEGYYDSPKPVKK